MFQTLRSKLIFSYCAVALLCLILAVGGTLAFAGEYLRQSGFRTLEEKRALATPLLRLVLSGNRPVTAGRKLVLESVDEAIRASSLRVILVDPTTLQVVEDSSSRYNSVGQRFNFGLDDAVLTQRLALPAGVSGITQLNGEQERIQYIAQRIRMVRPLGGQGGQNPGNGTGDNGALYPNIVVYAQTEVTLWTGLLGDLRGALLPAIVIALLISLAAAFLLARSISRPITKLADAAAVMAHGDYNAVSYIPVEGRDELGSLTHQFNEMVSEVARARKMQRDFVANVSHDLKTPLTSIQGFSQAILDGAINEPRGYTQAAIIINTEAQRMSRLVSELLNLTKLENGLSSLELQPTEIVMVISQLVLAMQPQALSSGVRLTLRTKGPGATVLADVDRLKQAFGNLIDNALKHTPSGGLVTVEVSDVVDGVQVTVTDTGRGIPPEDLLRVMERFYQIDKARSTQRIPAGSRNLGLGLAIAREIVQAHRGQISIESQVGYGTTVRVILPADARQTPTQPSGKKRLLRGGRQPQAATTSWPAQVYQPDPTTTTGNNTVSPTTNGNNSPH
jgi:signal transduction histidine kinase